jgi:hypothetical protein
MQINKYILLFLISDLNLRSIFIRNKIIAVKNLINNRFHAQISIPNISRALFNIMTASVPLYISQIVFQRSFSSSSSVK